MSHYDTNKRIIQLYNKDIEIKNKCDEFISSHKLIKSYKTNEELNDYIASLNSLIKYINPNINGELSPTKETINIIFELFSKPDYVLTISQCPLDNMMASIIISVYAPEYYFYSLSNIESNIILKKIGLVIFTRLNYPIKQTIIKQIYELLSIEHKMSPYVFCNYLLDFA